MIRNLSRGITSLLLELTKLFSEPLAAETAESISSAFQKSQNNKEATLEHFFAISPQTILWTEAVYDMVRKFFQDHQAILWRIWT